MTRLQIVLAVYAFVAVADLIDSRARARLPWVKALVLAPFWPLTLTASLLGRISR